MKCGQKECDYREFNGGDEFHDYYFCKKCGIGLRDDDVCYDDKFNGTYIVGKQAKSYQCLWK